MPRAYQTYGKRSRSDADGMPKAKRARFNSAVAAQTKKSLLRLIEHRQKDLTMALTPDVSVEYTDISGMLEQGAGASADMDGTSVRPLSVSIKGLLKGNTVTGTVGHTVRIFVFKWKPDSAVAAPGANSVVLQDGGGDVAWSHYQWTDRKNYTVLYDKQFTIGALDDEFSSPNSVPVNIRIRGDRCGRTDYNLGASTGLNHIYLGVCSNQSGTTSTFDSEARLIYSDA